MNFVPGADALVVELAEAAHHAVGDVGAAGEQGLPAVRPDDPSGVEIHEVDLQGGGEEGVNEWRALVDLEEERVGSAFYVGEGNCPRLQTLMKRKCLGDFAKLACIQPILHSPSLKRFGLI